MAFARKQTRRTIRRVTRKPKYRVINTHQVVGRIDAMMRELEAIRRQLMTLPKAESSAGLTDKLFGALGQGTWAEYDLNLDWARFSE